MRTPADTLAAFETHRASAILRTADESAAAPAMEAAVRGGFCIVEFTLTTPGSLERVREFAQREELVVGAGTVLSVEQAEQAVEAGACFLVSPVVDEAVIKTAHRLGALAMPGCHTPTELMRAHAAGAQLQKLFPAPAGGADYIKACLGPMPFLRIVPTNGVTAENVGEFLRAGAFGVGFVAPLFDPDDMRKKRWDEIEKRAQRIVQAVREE